MSCPLTVLRQSRQKTQVRQLNSIFSWMKLVRSISSFREQTRVRIRQKSNRTDNRELSLPSMGNFSSSNNFSLLCSILLATVLFLLAQKDWEKMERTMAQSGSSRFYPQEERPLRSGTQKSLERMRGKEQDSLPIIMDYVILTQQAQGSKSQNKTSPIELQRYDVDRDGMWQGWDGMIGVLLSIILQMKDSMRSLNVANEKNLRISQSKVRSVSELSPPPNPFSPPNLSLSPQDPKQARERLIEQNRRLKKQALELAERMDQILSQEKFKRKYGVNAGDEPDQQTQLKRLQARRQEQKIQELRTQITLLKRQNSFVHDEAQVIEKQNAIRVLEGELKVLQAEKAAFLIVRKEQTKALLFRNDEKYMQKIEKTRTQLGKIKEQCKALSAKTAQNQKQLMKTHQKAVSKSKRMKDIQQKIRENKQKMKRGNSNVVTIEMIAEIQSQIMKLQAEHKQSQRMWSQKLSNLEAECANRRLEQQKKLIILRDKEKEVRLNEIRLKQFKKLIIQNRSEKKEVEEHPKEYRSRRNIKYFERQLP